MSLLKTGRILAMSRPRPTHFLCLPLVGPSTAPQLAEAFAHLRTTAASLTSGLPKEAIRPLGTLHLTLGVMHLPNQSRLDEAVDFLHSLDLKGLLKEVEKQMRRSSIQEVVLNETSERTIETGTQQLSVNEESGVVASSQEVSVNKTKTVTSEAGGQLHQTAGQTLSAETEPEPLLVSLTSLGALPKAKEATILYSKPVDSTSRLYPFAHAIQQRFIEAGFMQQDMTKAFTGPQKGQLVPRPLLLHATMANTIYAPKKWKKPMRTEENNNGQKNFRPKKETVKINSVPLLQELAGPKEGEGEHNTKQVRQRPQKPAYVWAKNVPIDRLCICEMGAKPLATEPFAASGGPLLGSEYKVVSQRHLVFDIDEADAALAAKALRTL